MAINTDNVAAALVHIDRGLADAFGRNLLPSTEIQNLLLDIRQELRKAMAGA